MDPSPRRPGMDLAAERRPWNVLQFVQQSSRFVNILPNPPFSKGKEKKIIQPGEVIWKAGQGRGSNEFTFAPLDDVVMGGASSSNFDDATGKWKGMVTDANNGGFIGIRSTPVVEYDMSQCQGVRLVLSIPESKDGDAAKAIRIKFVIRDSTDFNGIGWTTSVDISAGKRGIFSRGVDEPSLSVIQVPFKKQIPTRFAKIVSDCTFASDQIKSIQLNFSKFEYDGALNPKFELGDFEVQLAEIQAY